MMSSGKRLLLLSGGTALGAVCVRTMRELVAAHGFAAYGGVAGVSVGSLNGLMFAQEALDDLERLWQRVDGTSFFQRIDPFHLKKGLYSLEPLRKLVLGELKRPINLPYWAGVTDLQIERYWNVPHVGLNDEELADVIVASCSQPTIHHVTTCKTPPGVRQCADGGVIHVIPQLPPGEWSAVDVILCSLTERKDRVAASDVDGGLEAGLRALEIYNDRTVRLDIQRLKRIVKDGTPVTLYSPAEDPGEPFDASPETIERRLGQIGEGVWKNAVSL